MPIIQVTMGKTNRETKKALIEELSSVAIDITKVPASEFTVTIQELDYDNIGRSGRTLTDILAERK